MSSSTISQSGSQGDLPLGPPSSWTWSLSGPPPDPEAAILRDVWIDRHGSEETLLLTVSDPDTNRLMEYTALVPVDDRDLRQAFEVRLTRSVGKPLADVGELRSG